MLSLQSRTAGSLLLCLSIAACSRAPETSASSGTIRLCDHYTAQSLVAAASAASAPAFEEWRFDGPPPEKKPEPAPPAEPAKSDAKPDAKPDEKQEPPPPDLTATRGFEAFLDIADLRIENGLLVGKCTGDDPVLCFGFDPGTSDDAMYAVEVRMRVSAGSNIGATLDGEEKLDRETWTDTIRTSARWAIPAPIAAGDQLQTCTILSDSAVFSPSIKRAGLRRMFLRVTDAPASAAATFAIESVRFITRRQHFASIASGPAWQGLGDVFRQSLVLRSGEVARFDVDLPAHAWLDVAIGAIVPDPVRFEVTITGADGKPRPLMKRTVTTPERWEDAPLDLAEWSGQHARLELAVHSESSGALGLFGSPTVRSHGGVPATEKVASAATAPRPQGVILMITDTLRRDHLDAWSYARPTAPTLARLASEGARCKDAISQATWTKVSVPAILSSLYPQTHGIVGPEHRLSNGAVTIAEAFQNAGYATFATSSVPFSGKASNLQQGVEVLHERSSVGDLQFSSSKTARTFVDRVLAFVEAHRDVPFFITLHVFDPHSPFEPYAPYSEIWSRPEAKKGHDADMERVTKYMKEHKLNAVDDLPTAKVLAAIGIDKDAFVRRELDWYDESIRAMDAEVARLMERLESLGLKDKTLFAQVADHGEEFLEHGRHFHGQSVYGELIEVPMMVWGPAWVKPGTVVEPTVQTIDLAPTLLDLAGIAVPATMQGKSLAPLVARNDGGAKFTSRAAFSQSLFSGFDKKHEPDETESFSIVRGGFQLIHFTTRPEGHAEFELYDHANDPLDTKNLAAEQPDRVERMSRELELWKKWAIAARATVGVDDGKAEAMTPDELRDLQQLGYVK